MSPTTRWTLTLTDVQTVRFTCGACQAAVVFPLEQWSDPPQRCPGCRRQWHDGLNSDVFQLLDRFRTALQQLRRQRAELPFAVTFELDAPTLPDRPPA